jgi:MFS family permease
VVVAYLAPVAEPAGVNVGLFFTADALAVLAFRIPVGWLVDRMPPRPFVLLGLLTTLAGVVALLLPPSVPVFLVAGLFAGSGVLVITPLLMVLAHRSSDRDRGSAFVFFGVAMATGSAFGSIAGAPFVALGGFPLALVALGGTGIAIAAVLTLADSGLGHRSGVATRPALAAAPEPGA